MIMRRMILVLTVLAFAVPSMAGVTITLTNEGIQGTEPTQYGQVRVDYTATADVSAFALEVELTAGATVNDVTDYFVGECNSTHKGYGIFLDKINGIQITSEGDVLNYGSPIAHPSAPDAAGTGKGTSKVILEMGALYEDGNKPPLGGTLCRILYDSCNECDLTVATNATRGGVVLANATAAIVDYVPVSGTLTGLADTNDPCCPTGPTECMSPGHMTPDYSGMGGNPAGAYSDYADWLAVGSPNCWCASGPADANPRQCWGDADGASQGAKNFWVYTEDLNILLAGWQKKYSAIAGQTYDSGVTGLSTPLICADFDHYGQGAKKFRVYTYDLSIMLANWQQKNGPAATCP